MRRMLLTALCSFVVAANLQGAEAERPISERFAVADHDETPDFQRHVVPLLSKLGCNGRACHGSFQGQGGFRLSLFGYDFKMDHESLTDGDEPRADAEYPGESLMLEKPTLTIAHEGGKRFDLDSWQHRVLLNWIAGGAKGIDNAPAELIELEVTPQEFLFDNPEATTQLTAVAVWDDGTRENVTALCRFQSNDDQVADIDNGGLVTFGGTSGDTHVIVFYDNAVVPVPVLRPVTDRVGPGYPTVPTPTRVDELVVNKLRKLGVVPSDEASDAEFLRRVSLDITGTLPAPSEVEEFLADTSADKRSRKIDELLERPAYAAWWTTRLCDITGNSDDALVNVIPQRGQASREWYEWIHKRVADNVPYDEIVASIVLAKSRNEEESYADFATAMSSYFHDDSEMRFADREYLPYYWARRNVRQPEDRALSFAYSFLGVRIQCAQCHKHPFDQWTQDDFKQFTGFFRGVAYGQNPETRKEYTAMLEELEVDGKKRGNELRRQLLSLLKEGEVVPFQELYVAKPQKRPEARNGKKKPNRRRGRTARAARARLLGSGGVNLNRYDDPREPLMEWLRSDDNPYFARAFVNRVWAAYFNVGIVEPADDLSLANPPSNKELLDYLSDEFIRRGFDMKWLHREIANSRTYQLSWTPNETNRLDERNFSHAIPRRLPAEVAYDAVRQATASDEAIEAMKTDITGRAIAIPGAGRRSRNGSSYALTVFGKSARESNCDCDRSNEPSLLQTVFLRNDQETLEFIDRDKDGWVAQIIRDLGGKPAVDKAELAKNNRRQRQNAQKRIRALQKQIKELREAGDKAKARRLAQQLAKVRKRNQSNNEPGAADAKPSPTENLAVSSEQRSQIVNQAFLRTLSRPPSEDEMQRSLAHLAETDDTIDGVRNLLWALVNTKEFIVNH